jgi:hypothetical protein
MNITAWLVAANADADARGLPELKPLLETLARSTQALRDADGEFGHPAAEHTAAVHAEDEPRETRNDKTSE